MLPTHRAPEKAAHNASLTNSNGRQSTVPEAHSRSRMRHEPVLKSALRRAHQQSLGRCAQSATNLPVLRKIVDGQIAIYHTIRTRERGELKSRKSLAAIDDRSFANAMSRR